MAGHILPGLFGRFAKVHAGKAAQCYKCVPCYAVPESIPQYLVDYYLSKLPEFALKEDILYCRPKQKAPADDESP